MALINFGEYEPEMSGRIMTELLPGSTFMDVGANEGYFTVLASSIVGTDGRVVAVEPQRRAIAILEQNLALNGCTNVQIVEGAAGDVSGSLLLHHHPSSNTGATSAVRPVRYPTRRERVEQFRIDELLPSIGVSSIDLVKMDIEGYELLAIQGARQTLLAGKVACAFIELHPRQLRAMGSSPQDVVRTMSELGFACSAVGDSLWCFHGSRE